MLDNKTKRYHIPEQGIYLYARSNEGKKEMIILNTTSEVQILSTTHYNVLTEGNKVGIEVGSGKKVDFSSNLTLAAGQSMIIQF